ncbi:MAG: signal recognition particle-docking protein FtsY [Candidatus Krumholzibacteriia bacterium]|nr:signal recognition particle-docking protein FtsY [Candidatus Latescibacterota bacterium]
MNPFARLKAGLGKTRKQLVERVGELFSGRETLSPEVFERLEELLIEADLGAELALDVTERTEKRLRAARASGDDLDAVIDVLRDSLAEELGAAGAPNSATDDDGALALAGKPHVVLLVGVNGVGKTTTAAKLAWQHQQRGRRVLLAAGDTFRAAAGDQLAIWAERLGCELVRHADGADPAAVVHDALAAAKARGVDVVIADTAGRLHNKSHLMAELAKIHRVTAREVDGAPHEVLLVIDANTGQNAIQQSRVFKEATEVTGIVLAKLDGTARGGVIFAIGRELGLPVRWVGLGEGLEDLTPFDPDAFTRALLARD